MARPGRRRGAPGRGRKGAILLVNALALALASCTTPTPTPGPPTPAATNAGFDGALGAVVRPDGPTGGTLRLGSARDCPSWDPGATSWSWCWDVQRMYARQLVAFAPQPGVMGTQVVADLAESTGRASPDLTEWTYRLKSGVTWEDGTPVTAQQAAAGVRRALAQRPGRTDSAPGCPHDPRCGYPVPVPQSDPPSVTVQTPDDRTLVVRLDRPEPSLDYLLALPTAAPVRGAPGPVPGVPMATGPFRAAAYEPGRVLTLERNPAWQQATDGVRLPKVDRVELRILPTQEQVDDRVLTGALDLDAQGGVGDQSLQRVLADPALRRNTDDAADGSVAYLALFGATAPMDQAACRQALFHAIDRNAVRAALSDVLPEGLPARSMTPPTMAAYDVGFDPYTTGDGSGDLEAARARLRECGRPDGFPLTLAYLPTGWGLDLVDVVRASFARIGVAVEPRPFRPAAYYPRIVGAPAEVERRGLGAGLVAWSTSVSSVDAWWNPIASGAAVRPVGNTNYALLDRPVVNDLLASREAGSTDLGAQADVGRVTDRLVMGEAVYLPLVFGRRLLYRNPRVTDIYVNAGLGGLYDLVNVGVSG